MHQKCKKDMNFFLTLWLNLEKWPNMMKLAKNGQIWYIWRNWIKSNLLLKNKINRQ